MLNNVKEKNIILFALRQCIGKMCCGSNRFHGRIKMKIPNIKLYTKHKRIMMMTNRKILVRIHFKQKSRKKLDFFVNEIRCRNKELRKMKAKVEKKPNEKIIRDLRFHT